MSDHPIHEAAALFPAMSDEDVQALADDIRSQGLIEPITLFEGAVLDGRSRLRACEIASIAPRFITWDGDDPYAHAVSLNLHRRHLNASQKAAIAADIREVYDRQAKERQSAAGRSAAPGRPAEKDAPKVAEVSKGESRDQAAKAVGVNHTYVDMATEIKEEAPELHEAVKAGKATVRDAHKVVRQKRALKQRDEEEEQYQALVAGFPFLASWSRADALSAGKYLNAMSDGVRQTAIGMARQQATPPSVGLAIFANFAEMSAERQERLVELWQSPNQYQQDMAFTQAANKRPPVHESFSYVRAAISALRAAAKGCEFPEFQKQFKDAAMLLVSLQEQFKERVEHEYTVELFWQSDRDEQAAGSERPA